MIRGMFRYDSRAGGGPMQSERSANRRYGASASAVEYTQTDSIPISRQARMMRRAISPRFAIRTRLNMVREEETERRRDEETKFLRPSSSAPRRIRALHASDQALQDAIGLLQQLTGSDRERG